jgi:hypothetical protein
MFRAKEGAHLLLPRLLACLGLALSSMEFGCSTMTGLRSVGTDRPSWLGFWDRSEAPSPDPAADYYARYMHAAKDRADALAKRSAESPDGVPHDGQTPSSLSDDERLTSRAQDATDFPSPRRSRRTTDPMRDETIQVTLGPPEPLPALSGTRDTDLAWTASSPQGQGHGEQPPGEADPAATPRRARPPVAHRDDPRDGVETRSAPTPRRPARPTSRDAGAILARSEAKLRSLKTYQVKIARVERVGGRLQPEELILLSIRCDPKAVRLEWTDGPNQGREVIYSTRLDTRSLFVHMPKSAIPLPTMKIPIDSPMVMKNSRHSIAEAGLDTIIENLQKSRDASHQKELGRLDYRGVEKPPGLNRPSHVFTRRTPSGATWTVFLDASTMLPCMTVAKDPSGELDERYVYHEVRENPTELASVDAFDPNQRWHDTNGFLSRFARSAVGTESPNNRQSTTR